MPKDGKTIKGGGKTKDLLKMIPSGSRNPLPHQEDSEALSSFVKRLITDLEKRDIVKPNTSSDLTYLSVLSVLQDASPEERQSLEFWVGLLKGHLTDQYIATHSSSRGRSLSLVSDYGELKEEAIETIVDAMEKQEDTIALSVAQNYLELFFSEVGPGIFEDVDTIIEWIMAGFTGDETVHIDDFLEVLKEATGENVQFSNVSQETLDTITEETEPGNPESTSLLALAERAVSYGASLDTIAQI